MTDTTYYMSPLGRLLLAENDGALTGLWIVGQKYFPDNIPVPIAAPSDSPVFAQAKDWLSRYFAGEQPDIAELRLSPRGSEFQRAVWRILCEIPYGTTTTYGAVAQKVAAERGLSSMSAQAVGGAVGHNPISIIIPCHRVVGANGSLTGYAGGIHRKIQLLTHEGIDVSHFHTPEKVTTL